MTFITAEYQNYAAQEIAKVQTTIDPTEEEQHKRFRLLLSKHKTRTARPLTPIVVGTAKVRLLNGTTAILPSGTKIRAPSKEVLLKALAQHGYFKLQQDLENALGKIKVRR